MTLRAEDTENMAEIEQQWAVKAYHHSEIYQNLIVSMDTTKLKLTPVDDKIFTHFREVFPSLSVALISEDHLKSEEEKAKWRNFCEQYKDQVKDYNFGTLLRLNAKELYSAQNSTLVPRIQFYAIEIARNREGHNSGLKQQS